ncbi:MAG TPA: AraC family transcriptional regulator [Lachnoclostridium phytofermentans]|uniref:AraC family transcriptional regulator n=1 Tax=Lachnoclostridium phytofermentans TaxID=66219 RepID=A0A3D2X5G0_9FIRM|nr:AraC family transcriptional regulator [Lachnoclostridium phytofermentans]
MNNYNFELIEYNNFRSARIFITSIKYSNFHWHYEYEFVFVLKGSIKINTRPEAVILQEGDIILLNSKTIHELQCTNDNNLLLFIQIVPELFCIEKNENRDYYFYLNSKNQRMQPKCNIDIFTQLVSQIGLSNLREKICETASLRTRALVLMLVAECFENLSYDIYQKSSGEKRNENNNNFLMTCIDYIQNHFKNEFVLEDMYKEIGMSEKSVHRFLTSNLGISAKKLLTERRIDEARRLLKYTDKQIGIISDLVGFQSDKTFYRVFKTEVGITPNEYRSNGGCLNNDMEIKGYLTWSEKEAHGLLIRYSN